MTFVVYNALICLGGIFLCEIGMSGFDTYIFLIVDKTALIIFIHL